MAATRGLLGYAAHAQEVDETFEVDATRLSALSQQKGAPTEADAPYRRLAAITNGLRARRNLRRVA